MTYGQTQLLARFACCSLLAGTIVTPVFGQESQRERNQLTQPVYRVTEKLDQPVGQPGTEPQAATPAEHPLAPAIKMAHSALDQMQKNVKDYSATLIKRERIGGTLGEHEYMFVKIREKPFSVYTYFLSPEKMKGQEAIYVQGKNDNRIAGHGVGVRAIVGTVNLDPLGAMAMQGQRYPITEIGLTNLTQKLVTIAEADSKFGECEVKFFKGAKINGRSTTCIQVVHPVPRKNFLFNMARVFCDDELNMITRYEAYDWPQEAGGQPLLTEEYTYLNIKVNNNFTDADFDTKNPAYGYRN